MFGITAFSQSPFAALGGTVYSRDLTESVAASFVAYPLGTAISFINMASQAVIN